MFPPTPTFAQKQTVLLICYLDLGKTTATNLMEWFLKYLNHPKSKKQAPSWISAFHETFKKAAPLLREDDPY